MHSEMVRYDRVPTRTESEDNAGLRDGAAGQSMFSRVEDRKSHRNKTKLKRRGSNDMSLSSASCTSLNSDDDDYLDGGDHFDSADRDNETERSPLTQNNDPKQAIDLASDSKSIASQLMYEYPSSSFDLDDDDDQDELEANLKRYHLDFTSTENGDYVGQISPDNPSRNDRFGFSGRGNNNSNRCSSAAKYLWFSLQSVRQRARQRRAQMLLQQTERNWRQSLKICVLTNCDATDSGILLVVFIMAIWIVALMLTKNPVARRKGLILGILFFVVRVGTRPLYHWFLKSWQRRQLSRQQEPLGLNPESYSSPHRKASGGSFELRVIRGSKNNAADQRTSPTSTGSDPTIAAI
eukprot:jgi/Psemu1/293071/fgenesh1_pg.1605_\